MKRSDIFFRVREAVEEELEEIIRSNDTNHISKLAQEVAAKPDYADLRHRLAHLYYMRGQLEDALREIEVALGINENFIEALHLKATILSDRGEFNAALAVLNHVIDKRPADVESHYRRAVLFGRLGRTEEAIASAQEAVRLNSGHEMAHLLLAEKYLFEHEWGPAIQHYAAANKIRPHEQYCYILGLLHLRLDQTDIAAAYLEQALELKPNHLNSCVRLAILKVAQGEYEAAHRRLYQAVGFYPRYPDLQFSLAKVCLLMGRRDEAYERMRAALQINPHYAEARREMGYLYSVRNQAREAVSELRESLNINPDDEQAYINLGFVYSNQGEHDQAVDILERAVRRFPDSWRLYHSLGIVHLQQRSFPQAKVSFLEAVKINPELEAIQHSLRVVFQDESLLEEEREHLVQSYRQPHQRPELDHLLGKTHLDFHKEKAAVDYFQRSFRAGYKPFLNGVLLATVYANMQNFDEAIRILEMISSDGLSEYVRCVLLALFRANAGDHDLAARQYQRLMTEAPLFFHSLNGLPVCFREREELDDILDDYLDYSRFHERRSPLFCRIGELNANKGMLSEARQHFHHATILDPGYARAYQAMGLLALLRLDFNIALEFFLRAVDKQPDWPLPHLNLALIYLQQSRHTLASVSLRRYINLEPVEAWRSLATDLLRRTKSRTEDDSSLITTSPLGHTG